MRELQAFANAYQKEMNWDISKESYEKSRESLLMNYMLLTTEVGEVAEELRKSFNISYAHMDKGMNEQEAFQLAKESIKEDIGKEFADCLAYICKLANFFDIDLEENFYAKMEEVKKRSNKDLGN